MSLGSTPQGCPGAPGSDWNKDVRTGRKTLREAVSWQSYDTLAAAHSRALGTLSRDLAETILKLE